MGLINKIFIVLQKVSRLPESKIKLSSVFWLPSALEPVIKTNLLVCNFIKLFLMFVTS